MAGPGPENQPTPAPSAERARQFADRLNRTATETNATLGDPSEAPTEVLNTEATTSDAAAIETEDPELAAKLDASEAKYAAQRVRESVTTGWNPKKTEELSQDLGNARENFEKILNEYALDLIDQRLAEADPVTGDKKYTEAQVALEAAAFVYTEMAKLTDRTVELGEAKGPKYKEAYNKLKHNRKARFAIAAGLAGVSIGIGIASGGAGFLAAAGAAKIGWRSISGYMGGEGLQGLRQGRKIRKGLGKELADFKPDGTGTTQEQRSAMAAKLSSADLAPHLDAGKLSEARASILDASISALADRLFAELENGVPGERAGKAVDIIRAELTQHLDLQNKQIQADRKALMARRLSGLAGAAVLGGAGPLIEQITHWVGHTAGGGGAHEAAPAQAHTAGATSASTSSSPVEAATAHQPVEIHDSNYYNPDATTGVDHYGAHGVAVAEMQPGENTHNMAEHILSRFKGWHDFSQPERHVKIAHLAEQLAAEQHHEVGDRVRWTYEQAAGSYHFNPGAHLSNSTPVGQDAHFGPSPTNHSVDMSHLSTTHGPTGSEVGHAVGSTGGTGSEVSHVVGSTGGTGVGPEHASQLFESSTGPNFPSFHYGSNGFAEMQISKPTQPKQLAEYVLSQFDGWKSFSAAQQSLKTAHFANELATQKFQVGSKVKWAYDFARGCFNYNG